MILLTGLATLRAQTSITLTFTATHNGLHQPLDSINISNLTQGGDTTLVGNDTVLLLDYGTGIGEWISGASGQFILYPVTPNPVIQTATIRLFLPKDETVTMKVSDLTGRELAILRQSLQAGHHTFTFTPGRENYYLLTVQAGARQQVQKVVSNQGSGNQAVLGYSGYQGRHDQLKKGKSAFPWVPGDQLRFIGFSALGTDTILDNSSQSVLHTFHLKSATPPPVVDFAASDTIIFIYDTIHFTDLSTGNPLIWKWYFGDGDSSSQQNPSHIYTLSGQYNVTLFVSNANGSSSLTRNNYITVNYILPGSPCPGTMTVIDFNGNVYNTVQIGNQCWMRENLRASHYRNGTVIPNITDDISWPGLSTGARCWYNDDSSTYAATWGALYNWYAVNDSNGLCPTGWHVATDVEWTVLTDFLGGSNSAGGVLKEAGTAHWNSPNTGATNASGFTALAGGSRFIGSANYYYMGSYGYWWSSLAASTYTAWNRVLINNSSNVDRTNISMNYGFSVRCIRDN